MIKIPPKNRGQSIYWNQLCLRYNKPTKPVQPTKQELYKANLLEVKHILIPCQELSEVFELLQEIDRILGLKTITKKHLDKISNWTQDIYNRSIHG